MRYLKYITGVVAGITLVGCSSFLEENPDQRTTIDSPDKIKELLVFAYPSANNFYALEAMTDNFDDSKRTQNSSLDNTAYYSWQDEKQEDIDSPAQYWAKAYEAIAQANQALKSVEDVQMSKEMYEGIKGEALLARAYSHWMLVTMFSEAYDPATAGSKMGVPYVDEVEEELMKNYHRGTLAETYEKIEADIVEGVRLAKGESFFKIAASFHFTKDAGRALATRFFAHKGEWDKVMEYSAFLTDKPTTLRNYDAYLGMPAFQGQKFGSEGEKANLLIVGSRTIIRRVFAEARFGFTDPLIDQFRTNRYNPYNRTYAYDIYGAGNDVFFYPRFYEYFVYSNQAAGIGQPYVNIPLLTTDETYLHRIEAVIYAGDLNKAAEMIGYFAKFRTKGDLNESTVKLQNLLSKVADASEYQTFYTLDDSQRKLFKYVAEMRRLEFFQMGIRWFDIKRFNLPVQHRFLVEGTSDILTANDARKAIQLPQSALSAGLTPNQR